MAGVIEPSNANLELLLSKARRAGEDAARGLAASWPEAERLLQGIWHRENAGLSWDNARNAAYAGWLAGKAALMDEHTPPIGDLDI